MLELLLGRWATNLRRTSTSYLGLTRGVPDAAISVAEAGEVPKYVDALNNPEGPPPSAVAVRGGSALRLCRESVRRSAEVQMVAIRSNLVIPGKFKT